MVNRVFSSHPNCLWCYPACHDLLTRTAWQRRPSPEIDRLPCWLFLPFAAILFFSFWRRHSLTCLGFRQRPWIYWHWDFDYSVPPSVIFSTSFQKIDNLINFYASFCFLFDGWASQRKLNIDSTGLAFLYCRTAKNSLQHFTTKPIQF